MPSRTTLTTFTIHDGLIQHDQRGLSKQQTKDQPARKPPTPEEMDTLKMKKAWEVAIAPAKQLPMNAIGMYMTGNSLQIFSIFMVLMLFKTPFTALVNIQSAFQRFESEGTKDKLLLVKLVYIATNLLAVGLGVWKVGKMGLLPYVQTTRSNKDLADNAIGRRGRIGWLGKRRVNH